MLTNTQQAMQQAGVNVMAQTNTNAQTIKAGTIVVSTVPDPHRVPVRAEVLR